jgi:hypothetical protein
VSHWAPTPLSTEVLTIELSNPAPPTARMIEKIVP